MDNGLDNADLRLAQRRWRICASNGRGRWRSWRSALALAGRRSRGWARRDQPDGVVAEPAVHAAYGLTMSRLLRQGSRSEPPGIAAAAATGVESIAPAVSPSLRFSPLRCIRLNLSKPGLMPRADRLRPAVDSSAGAPSLAAAPGSWS